MSTPHAAMTEVREQGPAPAFTDPIAPLRIALRGHYEIERQIGQGAYATVYLARDLKHERTVAIKVLNADPTSETGEIRFIREIRLVARLQHPNILPLHDSGHVEALLYYVMPFVDGETLRLRMHRERQMDVDAACMIARETADALAYAHKQGIVHRDIKPENILLSGGHAIVADFGIARAIDVGGVRQLTVTGVAGPGTPAYMSPEQLLGDRPVDARSDIYSLGCVLYEMLAARAPFPGKDGFVKRFTEPPPHISSQRRDVPAWIDGVLAKALSKNPGDRYATATDFVTALGQPTPTNRTPRQDTPIKHALVSPPMFKSDPLEAQEIGAAFPDSYPAKTQQRLFPALLVSFLLLLFVSVGWYISQRSRQPVPSDNIPTLAVLPFENLGRADDAYFAAGMTEEISSRIGRLAGLRVIGRQSARGYANSEKSAPEIGRELGASYVLTGSVRWDRSDPAHHRVRVSPTLVRVSDGTQVWSDLWEDEMSGIFQIQSRLAESVTQALHIQLSSGEQAALDTRPTDNLLAYDLYLRGNSLMLGLRGSDMVEAARLLDRATQLDPNFTLAYVALGVAHTNAYWFIADLSPRRLQLAKAAIDHALELQPNLPEAHNALGNYYYHGLLDFGRALGEFSAAQRLSPNDADAAALKSRVERRQGRWDDAIANAQKAVELDPLNINYLYDHAYNLILTRRYDEAETIARRLIAIDPSHWLGYRLRTYIALLRSGDVKQALAILRDARSTNDPDLFGSDASIFPWPAFLDETLVETIRSAKQPSSLLEKLIYFQGLGVIALHQGDFAAAKSAADSILKHGPPGMRGSVLDQEIRGPMAFGYAFRGDRARALAEARKGPELFRQARDEIRTADYLIVLGNVAALVGAKDEAISAFERALAMPSFVSRAWLGSDPLLRKLREDPRFQRLLAGSK